MIAGYDEDPREIYEIPAIRHFYLESIKAGIPWFYFLGKQANGMGLIVLMFSCCDIEVKFEKSGDTYVQIKDFQQISEWLNQNFHNLNEFTDNREIPEGINREMSERASVLIRQSFRHI